MPKRAAAISLVISFFSFTADGYTNSGASKSSASAATMRMIAKTNPIATVLFEGDVTRNGKQIHFRGKELLVWKKQADGSWKIFRYMYDEIPAKK